MRRNRFAKIIATLGPATSAPETIRSLFAAGVDVFRLNFSHGDHDGHRRRFEAIRAIESATGRPIGILADLQGPKLRVGEFAGGSTMLEEGRPFALDLDPSPGGPERVALPHPEVFTALRPGTNLLLDDGKIRLVVETCGANFAGTRIRTGGEISDHKGVNIPDAVLPVSPPHRQGPGGSRNGAGARRGLDRGVVHPAPAGSPRVAGGDRGPRRARDEAREAGRARPARGDRRSVRRDHDRARRPRRGAPARGRPHRLAPDRARLPQRGQTGDRGDPDARIDGVVAGADEGGSLRRRNRDLRGRGCGHALGGDGDGALPRRGRGHHAPNHRPGGARPALPGADRRDAPATEADRGRRDLRCDAAHRADPFGERRGHLHELGVEQPARGPRAAERAHPEPDPAPEHRAPPRAGMGHPFGVERGHRPRRRDGGQGLPHRAGRRIDERRRPASSSWPGCPSGSRERRTCSASRACRLRRAPRRRRIGNRTRLPFGHERRNGPTGRRPAARFPTSDAPRAGGPGNDRGQGSWERGRLARIVCGGPSARLRAGRPRSRGRLVGRHSRESGNDEIFAEPVPGFPSTPERKPSFVRSQAGIGGAGLPGNGLAAHCDGGDSTWLLITAATPPPGRVPGRIRSSGFRSGCAAGSSPARGGRR